jgi:hypothetical protein
VALKANAEGRVRKGVGRAAAGGAAGLVHGRPRPGLRGARSENCTGRSSEDGLADRLTDVTGHKKVTGRRTRHSSQLMPFALCVPSGQRVQVRL